MIRINQIKINVSEKNINEKLKFKAGELLKIKKEAIVKIEIVKRSIDARHKPQIMYVYSVNVFVENENKIKKSVFSNNIFITKEEKYTAPPMGNIPLSKRPVIAGMGPAGLFCGYFLARSGYKPLIIERGECVRDREKRVGTFFETGILDTESNVQFGEGGAGTFSDGKLNTMVKDKGGRNKEVLKTFAAFGAKEEILYVNKPHIGTDILCRIVENMRNEIIRLGGEVRFNTKLTKIRESGGKINAIEVCEYDRIKGKERLYTIDCSVLVLALGHSARDTFEMLLKSGIHMEPKAFAVGVRIEHPQEMINMNMYGVSSHEILEAADYKVTYSSKSGRGVYSFCMCPGGYVVNASSEKGRLAVNGMSYSKRDGENANSAIIVTVTPEDYGGRSPLSGMNFQRKLEENAYREGKGKVPVQTFGDFENNIPTLEFGDIKPMIKGDYTPANIRNIFPEYISSSIIEGIHGFAGQIQGFDRKDAVLSGVESRTSSPVRILRDESFCAGIGGIYPCGEGAGYAGGITSAAMDGIRIAEAIISKYAYKY